jgi:hypothetical protein
MTDPGTLPADPSRAERHAAALALIDRQIATLTRLTDIGMEFAEELLRVTKADDGAEDGPLHDPELAFDRIARAVRMTIALQARLLKDQADLDTADGLARTARAEKTEHACGGCSIAPSTLGNWAQLRAGGYTPRSTSGCWTRMSLRWPMGLWKRWWRGFAARSGCRRTGWRRIFRFRKRTRPPTPSQPINATGIPRSASNHLAPVGFRRIRRWSSFGAPGEGASGVRIGRG